MSKKTPKDVVNNAASVSLLLSEEDIDAALNAAGDPSPSEQPSNSSPSRSTSTPPTNSMPTRRSTPEQR